MSWPAPAEPIEQVALSFDAPGDTVANLSASVRVGDNLFVGADEACAIERLTIGKSGANGHRSFPLAELLDLADPDEEADIEGLAFEDGWLWVVGSHARTRPNPKKKKKKGKKLDLSALADLKDTRPRCLLARLPLIQGDDGWEPVKADGDRKAGLIRQNKHGSALAKRLAKDELLAPFTCVPAKEGGVDVEGIAVCGERVALGMRGPVISGLALLLELQVHAKASGKLGIASGPAKRFLAMEGLGIRDLKRRGDDLLILAGPTTNLSGPCAVYGWENWAKQPPRDAQEVEVHVPTRILELPFGRGFDHPEGLALWEENSLLVVCDSPGPDRLKHKGQTILTDLYQLPG
jgi:hypothetical protein